MTSKALRCITFLWFGVCAAYAQSRVRLNGAIIPLGSIVKRATADADVFRLDDGLLPGNQLRTLQSMQIVATQPNSKRAENDNRVPSVDEDSRSDIVAHGSKASQSIAATEHLNKLVSAAAPEVVTTTTSAIGLETTTTLTKTAPERVIEPLPQATPITLAVNLPNKNATHISPPQSPVRHLLFENILGLFQNPQNSQSGLFRNLNNGGTNQGILGAVSNTLDQLPIIGSNSNGAQLLGNGMIKNSLANARDAVSSLAGDIVAATTGGGSTTQGSLLGGAIEKVLEIPAAAGSLLTGNRGIL